MIFQRLRLHGFKSFCDATDLVLESGLTGVVGPNGCGKSNLVEAMRWVMGESSYKAMRASGMDDVIFSGSSNRPGRNSAEVTLVLDNTDRTAPSALNDADILEVTRRIERENGSVYKVNGKDVRARDVQLLFADASTGAHSPALVRQGQIGELIAAKPVKRRALLEEAAGISGLYSRRHEAELRLRGAETNLDRVDDIIAQVEGQLDTLKRQARLAVRYRNVSGDIRKAEAALFHVRWVAARVAEKETEAAQGQMVSRLADANHMERKSAKALELAEQGQQPLREAEAKAGAAVQRLTILREQLEVEIQRAGTQQADLENRMKQISGDRERETRLVEESRQTLKAYEVEKAEMTAQNLEQSEAIEAARAEAAHAQAELEEFDKTVRADTEALAQLRARRSQAERSAQDAQTRTARLSQQIEDVSHEAANVSAELEGDEVIGQRRKELEAAKNRSLMAEKATLEAEKATRSAQIALDEARPALGELESQLGRLESEAETLARVLNVQDNELWPAIVDALKVSPGYEIALGAALGDDLEASSDSGAPVYWATPGSSKNDPELPAGVTPLSEFVTGVDSLKRGLKQIGLVNASDGARLMGSLQAGQRLVTLEGDLWRWDGLVFKGDAPSPAAQRLSQRNRLADLDGEISKERADLADARERVKALTSAREQAQNEERTHRENWRQAQHEIADCQNRLDVAQKAVGDLVTRKSALEEAKIRLASSLSEAQEILEDAQKSLSECEPIEEGVARNQKLQAQLLQKREKSDKARLALGNFENANRMRANRISQLENEMASWQRREASARAQLETLTRREQEIADQLKALAELPDSHSHKREVLDSQLEDARHTHKICADKLAEAQSNHRELDRASRAAASTLGEVKAEMARIDERLKGLIVQRQQIEQMISETLGIMAEKTAEVAGIKPEHQLPDALQTERRVERLKAERERLGGVNLTAEKEMKEVGEKLEIMINDKNDLVAAIAKLRTGISSLNREGRTRLTEAFDKVNAHFSDLFTSLFGGGTAELTFVESDDPLEAGLEILATPPGKKPQPLSLLSGGEQALTALALIFAVFLTNPAPICVLDEVDAPLDDANVERFCNLLDSMRQRTQTRFLVITHNPITMSRVDRLFGVTMAERGVSQLVSVDLATAQATQEAG